MTGLGIDVLGGGSLLLVTLAVLAFFLYMAPIPLWIAAWASGAYVGLLTLIAMRLRRVPPATIVTARISAVKAGLDLSLNDLEAHYLAGGNVVRVVNALISADKASIPLGFKRAAAIDLAGRDVLEAVKMSVIPKVIETPRIAAVAKDGIQLMAVSRVTVRTNIDRLVGGAGEETIIARVGEGMVSTIGSAESHKHVLENPDHISKHVLSKGLDAGTAYEILSIDIADVDVGENIGAKLQIDQANADKQIAQAKAEERRAMAVALEQEMRARVVEAEAEVPRAMAEAFRQGNLASWTTTGCETCRPTRRCAIRSREPARKRRTKHRTTRPGPDRAETETRRCLTMSSLRSRSSSLASSASFCRGFAVARNVGGVNGAPGRLCPRRRSARCRSGYLPCRRWRGRWWRDPQAPARPRRRVSGMPPFGVDAGRWAVGPMFGGASS